MTVDTKPIATVDMKPIVTVLKSMYEIEAKTTVDIKMIHTTCMRILCGNDSDSISMKERLHYNDGVSRRGNDCMTDNRTVYNKFKRFSSLKARNARPPEGGPPNLVNKYMMQETTEARTILFIVFLHCTRTIIAILS